uniref:Uncharacterized protein n=1 Tax=Arundo donax TaxID=35708 RepID=A0A0A9FUU5_ARUDO
MLAFLLFSHPYVCLLENPHPSGISDGDSGAFPVTEMISSCFHFFWLLHGFVNCLGQINFFATFECQNQRNEVAFVVPATMTRYHFPAREDQR